MQKASPVIKKIPLMALFLKPSPFIDAFIEDELFISGARWDDDAGLMVRGDGEPLWAALSKTPPTTCTTPGKTRPAGYSKTGKYLPAKYIPSKSDKRAGK